MSGKRWRIPSTNDGEGSIPVALDPTDSRRAVNAPGPQPTSSTLSPSPTPAKATNTSARGSAYRPMKRAYASAATSKLIGECHEYFLIATRETVFQQRKCE